jgi:uncharacterized repeat protein (TIGR01451 family)
MRLTARCFSGLVVALLLPLASGQPQYAAPKPSRAAICFAPGTRPDYIARIYAQLAARGAGAPPAFQFNDGDRWRVTATNPCCLQQGQPTTLTWSIVPDGTTIVPQVTGENGPSNLKAFLDSVYGDSSSWLPIFQEVFDRWGQLTGVSYVYEPADDGATIQDAGLPGKLHVRGDVRIAGHFIDGNGTGGGSILAYDYFPEDGGDMVLDTADDNFTDTTDNSLLLRNTVAHEHGHGLGFQHVCPGDHTKLMEPVLSINFDGPQHDDILAGNRGYGDNFEDNDSAATATSLGAPADGTTTVSGVSEDDTADVDFYRFTIASPKALSVSLAPIGFTYLQGPQNSNGSCSAGFTFDSLTLNDLAFQVLASNGQTVLADVNNQPAGGTETLSSLSLAAGAYFIKVRAGNAHTVQLYRLSLTLGTPLFADLTIAKTDGQATAVPGAPISYTITTTNAGPQAAPGSHVTDTLPATLTGATWTCSASAGSSCPASGSGNIDTPIDLAVGGIATFTLHATVSSTATGSLTNTASIAVPSGLADPVPVNNTATDTDTLTPQGDITIAKTDGQASATAGLPLTYTINVGNAGPSAASATITDTPPATLTGVSWTCSAQAGAACTAAGTGIINDLVSLPPGGLLTYSLTATLDPAASGALSNTASATATAGFLDTNPVNNTATDTDNVVRQADLGVTLSDAQTNAVPGEVIHYAISVSNAGPSSATAATVTDTPPVTLTGVSWTCAASAGSSCPASGTGNINRAVDLAAGGSLSYVLSGTIDPAATGTLSDNVTVAAPAGVTDPVAGNDSATDVDNLTPRADLRVTKTDGQLHATPGAPVTYAIVASNPGPSDAPLATLSDSFPGSITGISWTCGATGGATCNPSGVGNIAESVGLPAGGAVTFTASGTLDPAATGTLANTASVAAGSGVTEEDPSDNTATDVDNLTLRGISELVHGTLGVRSLQAQLLVETKGYFWITQQPHASYEVVVDGVTGAISSGSGPDLDLLAADASTLVKSSVAAGAGSSRSLRFENVAAGPRSDEIVRVQSNGCTVGCGPNAQYRIRAWETTYEIARFNNSGTQITVLVVENSTSTMVHGNLWFRSATGELVGGQPVNLQPNATLVLNTASVVPSVSGTVTLSNDAPYGSLSGKAVAVEPGTGFTFDTPMLPRPR